MAYKNLIIIIIINNNNNNKSAYTLCYLMNDLIIIKRDYDTDKMMGSMIEDVSKIILILVGDFEDLTFFFFFVVVTFFVFSYANVPQSVHSI